MFALWCGNNFSRQNNWPQFKHCSLATEEGGFQLFTVNFLSYLYLKQSVMTRTARICSGTIRIGHFSCGTIEGGTPTQLAEYFVKRLSYETRAHNIISALHTPICLVERTTGGCSTHINSTLLYPNYFLFQTYLLEDFSCQIMCVA